MENKQTIKRPKKVKSNAKTLFEMYFGFKDANSLKNKNKDGIDIVYSNRTAVLSKYAPSL